MSISHNPPAESEGHVGPKELSGVKGTRIEADARGDQRLVGSEDGCQARVEQGRVGFCVETEKCEEGVLGGGLVLTWRRNGSQCFKGLMGYLLVVGLCWI